MIFKTYSTAVAEDASTHVTYPVPFLQKRFDYSFHKTYQTNIMGCFCRSHDQCSWFVSELPRQSATVSHRLLGVAAGGPRTSRRLAALSVRYGFRVAIGIVRSRNAMCGIRNPTARTRRTGMIRSVAGHSNLSHKISCTRTRKIHDHL